MQSDVALHLTNCFLEMSGHDTYKCELDKKLNLRAICINSMSDRAFSVYTEFYTHILNVCWFLQGQVWHEIISENTVRVGKQLQTSTEMQEAMLANQIKSIELQEKLLTYGTVLEKIMNEFYVSSEKYEKILDVINDSLSNLQGWLLGEVNLFDTFVFYVGMSICVMFLTSVKKTNGARLLSLSFLVLCIAFERLLSYFSAGKLSHVNIFDAHCDYYRYVWISRYVCVSACFIIVFTKAYVYRDYNKENNRILKDVQMKLLNVSSAVEVMSRRSHCFHLSDDVKDVCNDRTVVGNRDIFNTHDGTIHMSKAILKKPTRTFLHLKNNCYCESSPRRDIQQTYNLRSRGPSH